jgi:hypothetical protein
MSELPVPDDESARGSSHGSLTSAMSGAAKKISSPFEKAKKSSKLLGMETTLPLPAQEKVPHF